jgi:hypothetical protein
VISPPPLTLIVIRKKENNMTTPKQCFRCGKTEKLRKCNECKTIFCADCGPLPVANQSNIKVYQVIAACPKGCSGDITFQEDDPLGFQKPDIDP